MTRLRTALAAAVVALFVTTTGGFAEPATADTSTPFTAQETITRTHLVNGADDPVDSRNFSVTVSDTKSLRDRQAVTVSWTGAHPTGGLVFDHNSAAASMEEYPVVIMQCRGVDSSSVSASQQVSPETCWTLTPNERFQYSQSGTSFPAYRMDRYAASSDREFVVNQPDPVPDGCPDVIASHWIPFVAADGAVYPGGNKGCAGVPPEAANANDSLQPGNTTYGVSDSQGRGETKFIMQSADTNASLGCSATVTCTLEVIPIMGISCDAAGAAPSPGGMPAGERPSDQDTINQVFADCAGTGNFIPGDFNSSGQAPDLPVSGQLWWSASNWRNRIAVPLTFAQSASVCDVVNNQATVYLYGSESMVQATQQWAPAFCLDSSLFTLRHVQTSEPQAKNLLAIGNVEGALQGGPPSTPFPKPVVQAPAAVTGWAIAYSIDGAGGQPVSTIRLNARLIAKLLAESYRSCALDCLDYTSDAAKKSGFDKMATNPIDISRDPEFQALNPGIPVTNYLQSAATLSFMSSDSDVMTAVTSYINADPEARAWLNGAPDPWGMVVNPSYRGISLPVANWPLLDTHLQQNNASNECLAADPVPWLPLVASPLANPSIIALDMQFDIANSQVNCLNNGQPTQKLGAIGRQQPGARFLLGLVSLGDADRYELNLAQLETQRSSTGNGKFTDASGRTFVGPTNDALKAAMSMAKPDDAAGTWPIPYDRIRTDSTGAGAYPGTLLMSVDVLTNGLPAGDAPRYKQLLDFVAGSGQTPGLSNGQLPPGYLPLTSDNGLGALVDFTKKAADAVSAQQGFVPFVSGRAGNAFTTASGSGGGTTPGGGAETAGISPGTVSGVHTPTATNSTPLSPGQTIAPGSNTTSPKSPKTTQIVASQASKKFAAGPLGLALPVLALLALAGLAGAAWTSGVGRR